MKIVLCARSNTLSYAQRMKKSENAARKNVETIEGLSFDGNQFLHDLMVCFK